MNITKQINDILRGLIKDNIITKRSEYTKKGIWLEWNNLEVSATGDLNLNALNWLKNHIVGN